LLSTLGVFILPKIILKDSKKKKLLVKNCKKTSKTGQFYGKCFRDIVVLPPWSCKISLRGYENINKRVEPLK